MVVFVVVEPATPVHATFSLNTLLIFPPLSVSIALGCFGTPQPSMLRMGVCGGGLFLH